jgi:hypothetical protein
MLLSITHKKLGIVVLRLILIRPLTHTASANGLARASPLALYHWQMDSIDAPSSSISLVVQRFVTRPSVAWRSVRELPLTNGIPNWGMKIVENFLD